ncbi:MAG: NADAR family protein [Prevotella sp.]|nr:NADAR family protein [Prevotella sp.]
MKEIMTFRGKYQFLSNMYTAPFEWDGRGYKNSEAAFQSAKSLDPAVKDEFSEMTGVVAKREGKKVLLRRDWETVKDGIMEEVVREKFIQNPDLLKKLIDTGDMELVEGNRWHDKYWGVDMVSGEGENHLGIILMKLREELGGEDYLEKVERLKAEKAVAEQQEKESVETERRALQEQLNALPEYDFTGMVFSTRAFGKVTIKQQEENYLVFNARGAEKKFALPGCIVQGFLIPDDQSIVDNYKRRQELLEQLKVLEKKA